VPDSNITPIEPSATAVRPLSSIRGVYGLPALDRARLVAGTEALMRFGPRMVAELLLEVSDRDVEEVLRLLDGYARYAPVVEALGGTDWTTPLRPDCRPRMAA
jgi:hypothetical protein